MQQIIGRYAPSPTGDLHLGNLRTALIAWLHTRLHDGTFLLRMEDLDTPRVVAGSADKILQDLEWLGIDWDGKVVYQSKRTVLYRAALDHLATQGLVYPCFCSRKDIRQAASAPHGNAGVYPGTCANLSAQQVAEQTKPAAIRLRVNSALAKSSGDFVIKRADNLFAYQLAVVVDDLDQGVTDVVRGADLLESTPRQRYLAEKLKPQAPQIAYYHVALMLDQSGQRMSKRDGSLSAAEWRAGGKSAADLIGELAFSLQLIERNQSLTAAELLTELSSTGLDLDRVINPRTINASS